MARFSLFFAVFCSAAIVAVFASSVVDLTPENFDTEVDGTKDALVEFFAPWCGHCKSLAPEYEIVGDAFAKSTGVLIAKVDADQHKSLGERFGINGFPTIKFFPKGSKEPEDYSGGRTADEIVEFINSKAGAKGAIKKVPSAVVALTPTTFDEIVLDKSKDVLVEFYAPWCGHCKRLAPDYEKVAASFREEPGVAITKIDCDAHKDVCQKYGVSGYPTIQFFPKGNKNGEKYEGGRAPEDFVTFINKKAGTARLVGGDLSPEAGKIPSLDKLAHEFLEAAKEKRDEIFKEVEKLAAEQGPVLKDAAAYYTKVLKTVADKGNAYVKTEKERLERVVSGALTPVKAAEIKKRLNILAALLSPLVPESEEAEKAPESEEAE